MTRAEERTIEEMCVVCNDHGKSSCGYEERNLQRKCPYNDFIERGYELAEKDLGWHSVDESLPPVDEEVIVLSDVIHGKKVEGANWICFGHIVDKRYCVDYDGWNFPGVHHWMKCPKLPEL